MRSEKLEKGQEGVTQMRPSRSTLAVGGALVAKLLDIYGYVPDAAAQAQRARRAVVGHHRRGAVEDRPQEARLVGQPLGDEAVVPHRQPRPDRRHRLGDRGEDAAVDEAGRLLADAPLRRQGDLNFAFDLTHGRNQRPTEKRGHGQRRHGNIRSSPADPRCERTHQACDTQRGYRSGDAIGRGAAEPIGEISPNDRRAYSYETDQTEIKGCRKFIHPH